jgi:hypothetical protein
VGGRGAIDNKRTLYFNHNTWEKLNQALLFCIEKKKNYEQKMQNYHHAPQSWRSKTRFML